MSADVVERRKAREHARYLDQRDERLAKRKRYYAENIHRVKARHQANRLRVSEVKMMAGCIDCGYNAHYAALDFDHLPEFEKGFAIGPAMSRSWESIKAEIAKCEVVCANCHRIRTENRRKESTT